MLGSEQRILFGEDLYHDQLLGKTFKISSKSFFQINTKQTEVLYQQAIEMAEVTSDDVVVDAYCGIGSITLNLADKAKFVYGVEIVEDAIIMAKENAKLNHIENVQFEVGEAEKIMPTWVKEGIEIDVLVVDPPRKGLDPLFIDAAIASKPRRIVYVSCNPISLAKDLRSFIDGGYRVEKVQPVDMFPQTTHVETIVLLIK
ncbi:23S rRNA (uracil(1939)-C(5))-methyltransferase RlmD [Erysipelothrix sp. Poltava]|nr:23S rRNA (uracil(1939)-C(5))-methyltransferase RlmD [Erysipelothrix sp. Poltava]